MSVGAASPWTEELFAEVKRLAAEGHSAGKIAALLGHGLTRNAIIGKLHRANIYTAGPRPPKKQAMADNGIRMRLLRTKTVKPLPKLVQAKPIRDPITIYQLTNATCRWPVAGEGAETLFCGCVPQTGSSYCWPHTGLARGTGTPSERRAA